MKIHGETWGPCHVCPSCLGPKPLLKHTMDLADFELMDTYDGFTKENTWLPLKIKEKNMTDLRTKGSSPIPSRMTASWPSWPSVGPKAAWLEPNHKMERRCPIFIHSVEWFQRKSIGNHVLFFSHEIKPFPVKNSLKQSIQTHQSDGWYGYCMVLLRNLLPILDVLWYQEEHMGHTILFSAHTRHRFHMSELFRVSKIG